MRVLAIDPGSRDGAFVIVERDHLVAFGVWSTMTRDSGDTTVLRCRTWLRGQEMDEREIAHDDIELSLWFRATVRDLPGPDITVLEGLFVPNDAKRTNPQDVIKLGENVGCFRLSLDLLGMVRPIRPRLSEWLRTVFRRGRANRKEVRRLQEVYLPAMVKGVDSAAAMLTDSEYGALLDACSMARHGAITWRYR